MWTAGILAACCAALSLLPLSRAQVVPFDTNGLAGICHASQADIRILPSSGFTRSLEQPFSGTTAAAPIAAISDLAGCLFQSFDPAFDALLGDNLTIYQVGPARTEPWAVESPSYLEETDEIIFSSYFVQTPSNISRVNLGTGEVTQLVKSPGFGNSGGSSLYPDGQVAFSSVGDAFDDANPPGFYLVDPYNGNTTILMNNFFGLRFNGFDDIQALSDGSLIGTDSNYTSDTPNYAPFKNSAVLPNDVWILPPVGAPRPLVADLLSCPNGVAVSPDEKTLYIGTGPLTSTDPFALSVTDYIYAFDLVNTTGGYFAQNKRVFAKSDNQYFDGFSVDGQGNLFAATGDGVAVFNPSGTILGKIILPLGPFPIASHPTNSIGFAGNRLIMLHNIGVLMLPLADFSIDQVAGS